VSSIWTPSGEHPTDPDAGRDLAGSVPERNAGPGPGDDEQLSPEQIAEVEAEMMRARAELGSVPVADIVANHAVGLWQLAVLHLTPDPLPDGSPAEDKIAAIGIRLRRWVSFHGIAINVEPELSHFSGIVPCGVTDHGVTSLVDLGLPVTIADLDLALKSAFEDVFGPAATRVAELARKVG